MVRVRVRVRVRVIFCAVFFCVAFFMLYFLCCIFLHCIYSLNIELTLTMQNIDVTQETIAQLRTEKGTRDKIIAKNWIETNWF